MKQQKLSSGSQTGGVCQCGAPVWSYYQTRVYKPGEVIPDAEDDLSWHWYLVCERGHKQVAPVEAPVAEQLSLW